MSASEATAPVEASAQPTRWSPGDVSKNQLNKSPQCAADPRGGFVQFREKFRRVHEGNTGAAPKSFRKKVERVVLNALVPRLRDGFAAGYLRLRQSYVGSGEKPIHLWLRLARDTRATTEVGAVHPNRPQAIGSIAATYFHSGAIEPHRERNRADAFPPRPRRSGAHLPCKLQHRTCHRIVQH